jgi:hypothetical protein
MRSSKCEVKTFFFRNSQFALRIKAELFARQIVQLQKHGEVFMKKLMLVVLATMLIAVFSCSKSPYAPWGGPVNTANPAAVVKLMFIHHSTGSLWIESGYGNLGTALNAANFYTTESDYGWLAPMTTACFDNYAPTPTPGVTPSIGDHTDTGDWPCWFNDTTMPSVYTNTHHEDYPTNTMSDPGGENEVIMFKSCFPNSEVGDDITDEQAIYNSLLPYFAAHTDKLFILVIPPPMQVISNPAKTRELSNWLADRKNGWLSTYTAGNVFAFDYYNVLTHPDNHHYVYGGYEYHIVANAHNTLYYPTGDDHPSAAGQQKATNEFVPLLKAWWHEWKGI